MAVLTADRFVDTKQLDAVQGGYVFDMAVAASDIIFKGAILEVLAAGHVQPAGVGSSLQGAGLALDNVDNSGGSAGDLTCRVLMGASIVHALTSTVADIGSPVYASDDSTLTLTAGTNALIGWMLQITTTANIAVVQMKLPGLPLT